MLVAAVGLSCAGFIVPPLGEISDSVLWLFAQCLLYAGSILGVSTYVDGKISEMRLSAMPPEPPRPVSSTDNHGQGGPPGTSALPDLAEAGLPDEEAPIRARDSCDGLRDNGPRTDPRTEPAGLCGKTQERKHGGKTVQ